MKISRFMALAVVPAALALTATAASAGTVTQIGQCGARGDYATCDASGTARGPVAGIEVRVYAAPNQQVEVYWDVVCSYGKGAGSKSGSFGGRTSLSREIPHPYAHPSSCIVAAGAQLQNGGRSITVKIVYWR